MQDATIDQDQATTQQDPQSDASPITEQQLEQEVEQLLDGKGGEDVGDDDNDAEDDNGEAEE